MQRVRKSKEGVSPVIATILMVAITVVLAAVLYVLVSGFLTVGGGPRTIGVNVQRDSTGNYTMKVIQSISGLTTPNAQLTAQRSGAVTLLKTPLASLTCATNGATFNKVGTANPTAVEAGDFINLVGTGNTCAGVAGVPATPFAVGDSLEISDSGGILWSGKIN